MIPRPAATATTGLGVGQRPLRPVRVRGDEPPRGERGLPDLSPTTEVRQDAAASASPTAAIRPTNDSYASQEQQRLISERSAVLDFYSYATNLPGARRRQPGYARGPLNVRGDRPTEPTRRGRMRRLTSARLSRPERPCRAMRRWQLLSSVACMAAESEIVVMKFGGTSVAGADDIRRAAAADRRRPRAGQAGGRGPLGARQDDRPACRDGPRGVRAPACPRDGHAALDRRADLVRALRDGDLTTWATTRSR